MLALITQTKLPRPWLQLGAAGAIHVPVKAINAEPQEDAPAMPAMPSRAMSELQAPNVGHKPRNSRIPRLIRIPCVRKVISSQPMNIAPDLATPRQTATTATTTATSTNMTSCAPVVRSTRTSRCRIRLAHPDWSVTDHATNQCVCMDALQDGGEDRYGCAKRKMEPNADPLKHLGKPQQQQQQQMLCLQCCDGKQVDVPWHLIKRYSTLLRQRLKQPNEPLHLDTISSQTLLRLIMWMEQHSHDDLCKLEKMPPSVANASTAQCTWDEQFLGFNVDSVLQLLLASNYLGIHPLLEHVTLYFHELVA